jgi:hypothetical protein
MSMENKWNYIERGKPNFSAKPCFNATLSTTNPTLSGLEMNRSVLGWRPSTNHQSHGTRGDVKNEWTYTPSPTCSVCQGCQTCLWLILN